MSKLVIIAGPQASGKSTLVASLGSQPDNVSDLFPQAKAPLLFPLQESRQIIAHKHMLLGAIFMNLNHEKEVVECDLGRMDLILRRHASPPLIYLDECNVFTLAHAAAHGITALTQYWDDYISRLRNLDAVVIFLDVPPEISWERRRRRYEKRLVYFPVDEHESIRRRYRDYLDRLHPLLLDIYERLPFPKTVVDGCCSQENVTKMVCQQLARLASQ